MISEELRKGTAIYHQRLEEKLALFERVQDLKSYGDLIHRFLSFYSFVEPKLMGLADWKRHPTFEVEERLKLAWLRRDLFALDRSTTPGQVNASFLDLEFLATFNRALGCLYVLEGSTLGGTIISKHFSQKLGLTPDRGLAYFTSYAERTGEMWRRFQKALSDYVEQSPNPKEISEEIVQSACQVFELLEKHLCSSESLST